MTRIIETDEVTPAQAIVPPGQPIPPIVSQVDFTYDNRNRLTREMRVELGAIAIDGGQHINRLLSYDVTDTEPRPSARPRNRRGESQGRTG